MTKKLLATMTLLGTSILAQFAVVGAQIPSTHQPTTEIHGNVTDPSGAVIPGAMVTVSSGAFSRTVSTDDEGQYAVPNLTPGQYRVRVHFGGFAPFDRSNFVVTSGRETEVNTQLELRESRQSVTVYE